MKVAFFGASVSSTLDWCTIWSTGQIIVLSRSKWLLLIPADQMKVTSRHGQGVDPPGVPKSDPPPWPRQRRKIPPLVAEATAAFRGYLGLCRA